MSTCLSACYSPLIVQCQLSTCLAKLPVDFQGPDECEAKKKIKWLSKDKLHWPWRGSPLLSHILHLIPACLFKRLACISLLRHSTRFSIGGSGVCWRGKRWRGRKNKGAESGRVLTGDGFESTQSPIYRVCPLSCTAQWDQLATPVKKGKKKVVEDFQESKVWLPLHLLINTL